MDIFDSPYYRRNKFLLTCLGQWPYQDPLQKRLIRIVVFFVATSILVPEICQLLYATGDLDLTMESLSTFGVQTSTSMKFSNYIWNANKIKKLTDRIHDDWKCNIGPQLEIIKTNAEKGRKLTHFYSVGLVNKKIGTYHAERKSAAHGVPLYFSTLILTWRRCVARTSNVLLVYSLVTFPNLYCILFALFCFKFLLGTLTVYMYSTLASYLTLPMVPRILDMVMPLNETRPMIFPLPIRYGDIDQNKFYLPMMLHTDCVAILTITVVVAVDSSYAVYVQHACGLFAAVGDKLERLMGQDIVEGVPNPDSEQQEELTYQEVVTCVKMHSDAIEFAEVVESSQYALFFFLIGATVFCMSIAGYQTVMNLDRPGEAFRCAAFSIAQVAHIFFLSLPGQKLIDHSEQIHEWVYGSRWYDFSARSKTLLQLMMLRSEVPCKLTAGKLYVMSLANFSMIVRTSVSYFTVLTSFR